ncbi:MAG: hypothetical protein HYW88_02300 [Candidatus Sungbacteria bacterium]|nr:hypothetical protein [Candidatus Sungbacteria bacterium]
MKEVEEFFLEASRQTYAADAPKTTIAELPKSKVLRYERGDWLYVDCYFSANGKSFGTTTIWFQGQPVWGMQYHGHWNEKNKRIIPFLKRALKSSYEKGEFLGGRGPVLFNEEELSMMYRNSPNTKSFREFEGTEWIFEFGGDGTEFIHNYSGMALV